MEVQELKNVFSHLRIKLGLLFIYGKIKILVRRLQLATNVTLNVSTESFYDNGSNTLPGTKYSNALIKDFESVIAQYLTGKILSFDIHP